MLSDTISDPFGTNDHTNGMEKTIVPVRDGFGTHLLYFRTLFRQEYQFCCTVGYHP